MAGSKIYQSGIQELMRSPEVDLGVKRYADALLVAANLEVPVDTGALKQSGHVEKSVLGQLVIYDEPYAQMVHDGTKPHVIRPRGNVLRWTDKSGGVHYAKFVNHPGTKANRWLERAIMKMAARA